MTSATAVPEGAIAIIGVACRFPGARDITTFWDNLREGREAVRRFTAEELLAAGADPAQSARPGFVPAGVVLDDIDCFDASFFGIPPRQAQVLDPQHRLFLETAWAALEAAAVAHDRDAGRVGVFAGSGVGSYFLGNLLGDPELLATVGAGAVRHANRIDNLATRVAYHLDLAGAAITVQTGCSSGLVAVHLACQSLLGRESDVALAGAVNVDAGQGRGYRYQPGGINSPDGHCRPFDAAAAGTIFGSGVGAVVLKRAEDALADGDHVHALILGSAVNNDGAQKLGYTAPGIAGQAAVIAEAMAVAGVSPDEIDFVEAHGTGTALGDPVEVAALTRAFRNGTARTGYCALGSVKSNIGHLDAAAGIAGLIKATLAIENGEIPPSLNFRTPNPELQIASSPFFVPTEVVPCTRPPAQRRAGVSSFGIGGTNAHVVLGGYAPRPRRPARRHSEVLVLSAHGEAALDRLSHALADRLQRVPDSALADVAWTLAAGRRSLPCRRVVSCRSLAEARLALEGRAPERLRTRRVASSPAAVAFLFPGQGAQFPGMAGSLCERYPRFRPLFERALGAVEAEDAALGSELRRLLLGAEQEGDARRLADTRRTQPALFVMETALAALWEEHGIEPVALLGHSIGELVAAHRAGVMSLVDAVRMVVARGRMLAETPRGAMLALRAPASTIEPWLTDEGVALAAINGETDCVVGGPVAAIEALAQRATTAGVAHRRLRTSHAFHGPLVRAAVEPFRALVAQCSLSEPRIPFVSNVSGSWITAAEATSPDYWARHLASPVRFGDGLHTLLRDEHAVLLEVGPGRSLSSLARRYTAEPPTVVASLPQVPSGDARPDPIIDALGALWLAGVEIDWQRVYQGEERGIVPLPTYPFERERHWVPRPKVDLWSRLTDHRIAPGSDDPSERQHAPASVEDDAGIAKREDTTALVQSSRPDLGTSFVAPSTHSERALARVWERVLGIAPIGVHDDFFELGGDSVQGLQMQSLLAREGVALRPGELFERRTIAGLAAALDAGAATPAAAELADPEPTTAALPPEPVPASTSALRGAATAGSAIHARATSDDEDVEDSYGLSPAQHGMLFHALRSPDAGVYLQQLWWTVRGDLHPERLRRAWDRVAARHAVLRTSFHWQGLEQPLQVVHRSVTTPFQVRDLSELSREHQEARMAAELHEERAQGLALDRAPLVRLRIFHLGAALHRVVLSYHHLLLDGWSVPIVTRELLLEYEALAAGRELSLPPPPRFAEFIRWQSRQDPQAADRHWQERLQGLTTPSLTGLAGAPPMNNSDRSSEAEVTAVARALPEGAAGALIHAARRAGVTLSTVALGAWALTLSVLSRRQDVVFGVTSSGRERADEIASVVGMCLTTLPFRTRVPGSMRLADWLLELQCLQVSDRQLEHTVLSEVRRHASLEPGVALFDSILVFGNTPVGELRQTAGRLRSLELVEIGQIEKTNYALTVLVSPRSGLAVEALAAGTVDPAAVQRIVDLFVSVLEGMAAGFERRVREVPLVSGRASDLAAHGQGREHDEEPPPDLLAEIARHAVQNPEATAVQCGEVSLTYGELAQRSDRVARRLRELGVEPDVRVAIACDRSPHLIVALLAVLKAGGACVPLDPGQPARRRARMLAGAQVEIALAENARAADIAGEAAAITVVILDEPEEHLTHASPGADLAGDPDSIAYVLFTSGSTGEPKGVAMPRRTLDRLVAWQAQRSRESGARSGAAHGARTGETTLQLAALGFDVCFQEVFCTLSAGARLLLVDEHIRRDPGAVLDLASREHVTRLFAPFVMVEALAMAASTREHLPGSLREVVTAGEQLKVTPEIRALFSRLPGCSLDNQYGPTETHVVTAHRLPGDPAHWPMLPPIGAPLPGTRAYVLDAAGRQLPAGLPGELYIAGEGLARGYLGRPMATAERFLPDPFSPVPGARMYRTGDIVRAAADGTIEFVGRDDDQVKIRGYRVELGEVEAVASRHPRVAAAAATVRRAPDTGEQRLLLYAVGTPGSALTPSELDAHLRAHLPEYMVPRAVEVIPELPMTPSGKVDRRALPEPRAREIAARVAPRSELERLVTDLWADALGIDSVGVHDDFFALGGHSLVAVRLAAALSKSFACEVSVVRLFEFPTPARLTAWIERRLRQATDAPAQPVTRAELGEERPLSPAQQRLFALHPQCAPEHHFYHTATGRRLRGPLDIAALGRALDAIMARHEPLRTAYRMRDGDPSKRVMQAAPAPIAIVDLSSLPVGTQEREAQRLANLELRRPFDLSQGRLLRVTLLRLAATHHILLITCHQLGFDAWSREVLLTELDAGYAAPGPEASPPPLRYDDFVVWDAARRDAAELAAQRAYWARKLATPRPTLALDTDRPRPPVKSFDGAVLPIRIPPALVEGLRALSRDTGATMYMVMLTVYAIWLHAYSRQVDLLVGSSNARRLARALEGLVGPFNDFLVMRLDLSGDPSVRALISRARAVALEAYAHQDAPFTELLTDLGVPEDASRTPLFQAAFTYKRFLDRPEGRIGDLQVQPFHVDWGTARTDVTMSLLDSGREIVGFLELSTDLFDPARMAIRLRHAQVLAEAIVRDPEQPLSALPLAPADALRYDPLSSLTAQEAQYLAALRDRHTERTRTSRALARRFHPCWADEGFSRGYREPLREVIYPLFAERAEGARIVDADGNEYVDCTMSHGITLFGHNPEFLREALARELARGFPLGMQSRHAGEAAELITALAPVERAAFFGTRTEAMIVALRLCRAYTGRSTVVVFRGGYHGNADEMQLEQLDMDPATRAPGIPESAAAETLVLDYLDPGALAQIESCADRIACVLVEPVQSQLPGSLEVEPGAFLRELRTSTHARGIPLVFDETVFGFRLHPGGCQGWFGVAADLAVYGKPIGGGLPVGVVAGRRELLDGIDGGAWWAHDHGSPAEPRIASGSTYGGNPLSSAAVRAVLGEIARVGPSLQEMLNQRTASLVERLNTWLQDQGAGLRARCFGSRFGFVALGGSSAGGAGALFRLHLLERGVYLRGDCGSLSLAHGPAELEIIEAAVRDTVSALRAAGFSR